jgi:hypothetical protein
MIKMDIPLQTHRKGHKMGVSVGTIFKWFSPEETGEECEDGQCVGIVVETCDPDIYTVPAVMVKWWEMCDLHTKIDPNGAGPHSLAYIWQIGQLY